MLKNTQRLFVLFLLLFIISCAKTTMLQMPDESECNYGDDAYKEQCKDKRNYVRDEMERGGGGNKPFLAGCHVAYSDVNCTKDREVYIGDQCETGNTLVLKEWTKGTCHKPGAGIPIDIQTYDCNKLCKSKKFDAGKCQETAAQVCGKFSSAYCKCTGIN